MVNQQVTEEWLTKADEDFEYAKVSLEEGLAFYAQICFHLHQAAEKYLKSYIVAKELSFRKTHSLITLLQICEESDSEFAKLSDFAAELNPFYIETRYPGLIGEPIRKDQAEESLQMVEKIASFVRKKLQL